MFIAENRGFIGSIMGRKQVIDAIGVTIDKYAKITKDVDINTDSNYGRR